MYLFTIIGQGAYCSWGQRGVWWWDGGERRVDSSHGVWPPFKLKCSCLGHPHLTQRVKDGRLMDCSPLGLATNDKLRKTFAGKDTQEKRELRERFPRKPEKTIWGRPTEWAKADNSERIHLRSFFIAVSGRTFKWGQCLLKNLLERNTSRRNPSEPGGHVPSLTYLSSEWNTKITRTLAV